MAVKTRPYRIDFNGHVRMIEAPHVNAAIAHLASELVEIARPASAMEVAEFYRGGGVVEVAAATKRRKGGDTPLPDIDPQEPNKERTDPPIEEAPVAPVPDDLDANGVSNDDAEIDAAIDEITGKVTPDDDFDELAKDIEAK